MKGFLRLLALFAFAMLPRTALAQEAAGDWWGVLEVAPGTRLRLAFHIAADANGKLGGTLDSLDQNAVGLKLTEISVTGGRLALQLATPPARFEGKWDAAAKAWRGTWQQSGRSWPLILAAGAPPTTAAAVPALPPKWTLPTDPAVAALIDRRIAARPGAGMTIGLIDPAGARIVARGPGGGGAPFDGRTIFEIGSMSKVFTALILADMVTKGEVSLDDPAEKYLPQGARMPERAGRKISLRDLATHSSGLPRLPDNMPMANPADPYADYSEALLLDFLSRYSLPRDIGSRFEYSNLGYGLLGYLLARAAHTDYATLLEQRITGPLRLRDTTIVLSHDQAARFAPGYDAYMRPTAPWTLPVLAGAGAIRSTADDMTAFVRAALDPTSPIGAAMRLATAQRRPMAAGSEIGLAWIISEVAGRDILFHNGGTGGFRSAMALDPGKRRAVVILSNASAEPGPDDLAMHLLLGAPLQESAAPPPPPPATHKEISLPPEALDRFVGRYELAPDVVLSVSRDGGGLKAQIAGQPSFSIYPEGPLTFFWRVADAQARFTAGPEGTITGVVLTRAGQELNGKRLAP